MNDSREEVKTDNRELKRIIAIAEEELSNLKKEKKRRSKQRRIVKALEHAYSYLNLPAQFVQKETDRLTREVWIALQDGIPFIWFRLLVILFLGALLFAGYETYSFVSANWYDGNFKWPGAWRDDISAEVKVNYKETNIVSLYDQLPASDEIGLKNKSQEFDIYNNSDEMTKNINYKVNYNVNIVELNDGKPKVLNNYYLKYKVIHEDIDGKEVESAIGRFSDLKKNPDGSFLLLSDSELKDSNSHFKVILWVAEEAPNSEQGAAYTFMFRVTAGVERISRKY